MNNYHALVHNALPHGDAVEPLSSTDQECFKEIRDVLAKHGKLERFGLTLLHKHFELEGDEMLVENVDEVLRVQTIAPMKKADVEKMGGTVLETMWSLHEGEVVQGCKRACVQQSGFHDRRHVWTGS
jgi:hypothetical protein